MIEESLTSDANRATVALKGDAKVLIASLAQAFTNHSNVLTELLQNARRAGSARVEVFQDDKAQTLEVVDYGSGVTDMEDLLFIGKSGWDLATLAKERPFGIGLLAAVNACERIEVSSKGRRLAADTKDILAFRPLAIEESEETNTRIKLIGTKPLHQSQIEFLVRGFPIQVFLNGVELKRPRALSHEFIACEIGDVLLGDTPSLDFTPFLQGLPVTRRGYQTGAIVHLNNRSFKGRVPDRDVLVDEEAQFERIKMTLGRLWRERLERMKSIGDVGQLLDWASELPALGCADILNDIQILPKAAVSPVAMPNFVSQNYNPSRWDDGVHMDRASIESRPLMRAIDLATAVDYFTPSSLESACGDCDDQAIESYNRLVYLNALGVIEIVESMLDCGHWVYSLPNLITEVQVGTIEPVEECGRGELSGHCISGVSALACKTVRMLGNHGAVEVSALPVVLPDDRGSVVALGEHVTAATFCEIWSEYTDHTNHFIESWYDDDRDAVGTQLSVLRGGSPALLINRALYDLSEHKAIFVNRGFLLRFDRNGRLVVKESKPKPRRKSKNAKRKAPATARR